MMKKFLKKAALVVAVMTAMSSLAACGGTPASSTPTPSPSTSATATSTPEATPTPAADPVKVAVILSGPISDMSWNATAYNGLMAIEKLGAEVSYQENVPVSSVEDSIRTYATEGFDLIFLSTNSYEEVGKLVASDFPDVQFITINGSTTEGNILSVQIADAQQGFLMGAISAVISESKKVGFVGGTEIPPIIKGQAGFKAGAEYVDSAIGISSNLTGSMDDVGAAKETAAAMIQAGVDVVSPMANQSSLGVLEAAQEAGVYAVASGLNQNDVAPDAAVIAVVKDTAIAYVAAYNAFIGGTLGSETIVMGATEGVVYLSDWYPAASGISEDAKAKVSQIYQDLVDGKIAQ